MESEFGDGRGRRFVGRLLDGEAMTEVCREFGISYKTGYTAATRRYDGLPDLI